MKNANVISSIYIRTICTNILKTLPVTINVNEFSETHAMEKCKLIAV